MSRSKPVLPFRVLSAEAVRPLQPWNAFADSQFIGPLADGAPLPAWDAKLAFRLERDFVIDVDVAAAVGVDSKEPFCEFAVVGTTANGLVREVLFRELVSKRRGVVVHAVVSPVSDKLAKELILTSGLYLARDIVSRDKLAPSIRGSRLWELTERFRLEGGAARLPMYEVPFSEAFPGEGIDRAFFHVEIADDPSLDLESALVVYLNSEQPEFVSDVSRGRTEAEAQLWEGVLRRVLLWAMLGDEDSFREAQTDSPLWVTVRRWARQVWPNTPVENLRDLPAAGFSRLEAQLQSWILNSFPQSKMGRTR